MKPLLVGEMNPYGADPAFALYHLPPEASGGRLQRYVLGVSAAEYYRKFDRANLCAGRWDLGAARLEALALLGEPERSTYVLLGEKVASAFRIRSGAFSSAKLLVGGREKLIVLLPHPSGLCRTWNDPAAVARAREHLRACGVELAPERCQAARDGECDYAHCPQLRDGEPARSGRHCPVDSLDEEE